MSDSRDVIQSRLLGNIDDSYDKSEGSFFYDVEKPIAIELESAYVQIEGLPDKAMPDTATGKDLDRIVKSVGLMRKLTTKSTGKVIITGINGSKIIKGEFVASDSLKFQFLEDLKIENNSIYVSVECEKAGTIGNIPANSIKYFPKTLAGLQTVTNTNAFINGYNAETDEDLRSRYYTKVQTIVNSSNKNAFKNWALEVTGVGGAKVIPIWMGPGTVKVLIISSNKVGADETLINTVQNHIDPNKNGDGSGASPCGGGICTIESAIERAINVSVNITTTLDNEIAKNNIEKVIKEYLSKIAFLEEQNYVSYAQIGSLILSVDGITDYSNLLVNSGTTKIDINNEEVAVLGGVIVG